MFRFLYLMRWFCLVLQHGYKSFSGITTKRLNAPTGIRTRVTASRGQYDWPDYTMGALLDFSESECRTCFGAAFSKRCPWLHYGGIWDLSFSSMSHEFWCNFLLAKKVPVATLWGIDLYINFSRNKKFI